MLEGVNEGALNASHVDAVDKLTDNALADALDHGGAQRLGLFPCGGFCRNAKTNLSVPRVGRDRGVFRLLHQLTERVLHRRFTHAENVDVVADQYCFGLSLKEGKHAVAQHGDKLAGWTGKKNDCFAVSAFSRKPRGGAVGIGKYGCPLGNQRLLEIVFGHSAKASARGKERLDGGKRRLVGDKGKPQHLCRRFFGQIVIGRAETATHDHQIRALYRLGKRVAKAVGIIAHHALVID